MHNSMFRIGLGLLILFGGVSMAAAVDLTITNPSFEDPDLGGDGGFHAGSFPGWTIGPTGSGGAFDPAASFGQAAYDGNNVLWLNSQHHATQLLSDTVEVGIYTLNVYVNHRINASGHIGPNPYDIDLLVNGASIAATSKILPETNGPGDEWELATAVYDFGPGSPHIGGDLGIRFINLNDTSVNPDPRQQHFDLVSLTYVPEPGTIGLLGLGGLALLRRRRR